MTSSSGCPSRPAPVPQRTEGKAAVLERSTPASRHLVSPLGFHDIDIARSGTADPVPTSWPTYRQDSTMLPTGKPYRNDYIGRFTVRDEKIAEFAEYFDPLVFLEALGTKVG